MLLGWDFKWIDQNHEERETRTAQVLLDEVTYPMMMHQIIDDRSRRTDALINNLFVPQKELKAAVAAAAPAASSFASDGGTGIPITSNAHTGKIYSLKEGYGFISPNDGGQTIFFFHAHVINRDFNELKPGDVVEYKHGSNDKGVCAVDVLVKT
jgi:cold shock CspA family protein